jgi:epoxyqueuosine reductase QueG
MQADRAHSEIASFLAAAGITQWGVAAVPTPPWPYAPALPFAISLGCPITLEIIAEVVGGPTPAYMAEYHRINRLLLETSHGLAALLRRYGGRAEPVHPRGSPDPTVTDWVDARVFAHKTAATQAGLGWIGKTALFVSPALGPRVRLATVFTDVQLPVGTPVTESRCGSCRRCVDACPAGAGRDELWTAGMPRDRLLDFYVCEAQNASNIPTVGDICGICVAVCPRGRREDLSDPDADGELAQWGSQR